MDTPYLDFLVSSNYYLHVSRTHGHNWNLAALGVGVSFYDIHPPQPLAVVLGENLQQASEIDGVSVVQLCGTLNTSVRGGVALYDIIRRWA